MWKGWIGKDLSSIGNWFIDSPKSRGQYYAQSFLGGAVPLIGGYYSARDNVAYMDDYMASRGLSWSNIKYPSNTVGWSGGSALGHSAMSLSKTVTRLY